MYVVGMRIMLSGVADCGSDLRMIRVTIVHTKVFNSSFTSSLTSMTDIDKFVD